MWITLSPDLTGFVDPVSYLQIFMDKLQVVDLATNRVSLCKRTVEAYIFDVVQNFANVGANLPRLDNLV